MKPKESKIPPHHVKVRNVLAEILGVDEAECTADANLFDDLGADSLDIIELMMGVEEALDIEIVDETAEKWKTVGDICATVEKLAKGPNEV